MDNLTFYHFSDPRRPIDVYPWFFVYLHGQAKNWMNQKQEEENWYWMAPDMVYANQELPAEPGEYEATLYGKKVIAIVRWSERLKNTLCGRAYMVGDEVAEKH